MWSGVEWSDVEWSGSLIDQVEWSGVDPSRSSGVEWSGVEWRADGRQQEIQRWRKEEAGEKKLFQGISVSSACLLLLLLLPASRIACVCFIFSFRPPFSCCWSAIGWAGLLDS